ncbi:MAG: hypothetical protein ACFFD2_11045 [Promethearchaeota archaeon]
MLWLVVLLIVGIIGIVGYRLYYNPSLSHIAKQQKMNYIQRFQRSKTLIYQMTKRQTEILFNYLNRAYLNAGSGCYYGKGIILYLQIKPPQVTFILFSPAEDLLMRNIWKILQIKNKIGGNVNGTSHG